MSSSVTQPNREEMARLLEAAGSAYDLEAVEALIEGVLAAPAEIGTGWHVLVADPMPQQLATSLEALRAAKAAEYHDGLSARRFRSAAASGASRPPAEGTGVARTRRVHRAARRRASGRICAAARSASRVADRLYRVGRPRDRVARPRSAVCRWAVHVAGGRADRHGLVRDPSPGRGTTGAMARRGAQKGRGSRLRSLAAHAARGGAVSRRCGKGRCRAPRCPRQPARPGLARPTGSADRTCRAASRAILRRERRVEAHPAGAWFATGGGRGGRADDAGIDRLAAQHPRRRRAAHPAAIVICDPAAGRLRQPLHRPAQARPRARTPSRQRRHRDAARATGTGARCSLRPKAAGCRPIRRPPPPGCSTGWQKRERRSIAPPTRVSCRRHAKMPPKSRAPGRRITATARR